MRHTGASFHASEYGVKSHSVGFANNKNLATCNNLESGQLRVGVISQLEKGETLDSEMVEKCLFCAGFFIFFMTQMVVVAGHFYFYAKGYEFVTVRGTSMVPTLKDGQTAIISSNVPEGNLTNLIVVFGNRNICHRCIKDEGQWLTLKGDNNSYFERATRDELKAIFVKISENRFLDSILLGF